MNSIVSILYRYMLVLCFSSIFIFGGIATYFIVSDYQTQMVEAQKRILGDVENSLMKDIARVQNFIEFSRNAAQVHSVKSTRSFIFEAHSLSEALYSKFSERLGKEETKKIILHSLRSLVHDHEDSYIFIVNTNGTEVLNTDHPELEGVDVLNIQTKDGRYLIKEMISLVEKKDEGYINYLWTKPNVIGKSYQKKSYIKLFKPYNWIIGTGHYSTTVRQITQRDIIKRLSKINMGKDSYVFAGQYDGLSLLGPAKGKNVLNIEDSNGVRVVQELIRLAKTGGGFLTYNVPSVDPRYKTYKKLSYAASIPEWEWYIGTGTNINVLERKLEIKQDELWNTLLLRLSFVFALLLLYLLAIFLMSEKFKKMLAENFESFESFFRKATDSPVKIDMADIAFSEFEQMAKLANAMIDSRENARKELLKSEITYREIFNATKDAIAVMDISKKVFIDVNQAFLDFFGMSRNEAIGMSPEAISFNTPPYDTKYAAELFEKARSGESVHFEWMVKNSQGEPFWTDNLARIAYISGQQKLLIVMRDITERKKMQKIMVQTEKMMSVGGLAAGMAHEINNPLGVIMQVTQNIIRRTSPDLDKNIPIAQQCGIDLNNLQNYMKKRGITKYLHGIQNAGERAAEIVRSMLDFSRKSSSDKSSNNIESVIETAISLASNDYDLKKQYDFKKIKIIRDYSSPPMFNMTEMEISQVMLNLIKNAAQAISLDENKHKIPTITIRTYTEKKFVHVEIEDNGPGIKTDDVKRIFEPFYSTKSPGNGTGLGLSVSYFIITQNHGGNITVDSTPGEGTRFSITLPLV